MDWNWNEIWDWIVQTIRTAEPLMIIVAIEIFAVLLTLITQGLLARRMLLLHHRELVNRENNDDIETQLINVTDGNVMTISQLPDSTAVSKLFTNTASQKELKDLSRMASYSEPVIPFDQERHMILEKLFGIVAEHNRRGSTPIKPWLVIPTYWNLAQDRSCIRLQVVSEATLRKFMDWEWCKQLKTESRSHWTRLVVLHRAAHYYFGLEHGLEDEEIKAKGRVRRIGRMRLAIRDDDEPLRALQIDWTEDCKKEVLEEVRLAA